jgi:hypothetical protein
MKGQGKHLGGALYDLTRMETHAWLSASARKRADYAVICAKESFAKICRERGKKMPARE